MHPSAAPQLGKLSVFTQKVFWPLAAPIRAGFLRLAVLLLGPTVCHAQKETRQVLVYITWPLHRRTCLTATFFGFQPKYFLKLTLEIKPTKHFSPLECSPSFFPHYFFVFQPLGAARGTEMQNELQLAKVFYFGAWGSRRVEMKSIPVRGVAWSTGFRKGCKMKSRCLRFCRLEDWVQEGLQNEIQLK